MKDYISIEKISMAFFLISICFSPSTFVHALELHCSLSLCLCLSIIDMRSGGKCSTLLLFFVLFCCQLILDKINYTWAVVCLRNHLFSVYLGIILIFSSAREWEDQMHMLYFCKSVVFSLRRVKKGARDLVQESAVGKLLQHIFSVILQKLFYQIPVLS